MTLPDRPGGVARVVAREADREARARGVRDAVKSVETAPAWGPIRSRGSLDPRFND
jgi:hypothetical protein